MGKEGRSSCWRNGDSDTSFKMDSKEGYRNAASEAVLASKEGWITWGGRKFKEVGRGRFEFKSNSNPSRSYTTDIFEAPYCTCWPMGRFPTVPCCHLNTLRSFLKRLKAEQHTDQ